MVGVSGSDAVPSRYHYMISLLDTLKAFGGSSTSKEIYRWFTERDIARGDDVATVQRSGETRFAKEVRFARQLLFYGGLIANDANGSWRLTPLGWQTDLDVDAARLLSRRSNWKVAAKTGQARSTLRQTRELTASPTKGPVPQAWTGITVRDISGPAFTYAMRFGDSQVWKIGFTSNLTSRLAELNRHIPIELLGCRWVLARDECWPDVLSAYEMEQQVLARLAEYRTAGERILCAEQRISQAWDVSRARLRETGS